MARHLSRDRYGGRDGTACRGAVGAIRAKVRITAPSSDGDVAISSYDLAVSRCKPHHKKCTLEAVKSVKVHPSTLTVTVSGLKAHTTYYFASTATNSIGTGPASAEVHKKTKG